LSSKAPLRGRGGPSTWTKHKEQREGELKKRRKKKREKKKRRDRKVFLEDSSPGKETHLLETGEGGPVGEKKKTQDAKREGGKGGECGLGKTITTNRCPQEEAR